MVLILTVSAARQQDRPSRKLSLIVFGSAPTSAACPRWLNPSTWRTKRVASERPSLVCGCAASRLHSTWPLVPEAPLVGQLCPCISVTFLIARSPAPSSARAGAGAGLEKPVESHQPSGRRWFNELFSFLFQNPFSPCSGEGFTPPPTLSRGSKPERSRTV